MDAFLVNHFTDFKSGFMLYGKILNSMVHGQLLKFENHEFIYQ